jgi:uncharacterized membrane protein
MQDVGWYGLLLSLSRWARWHKLPSRIEWIGLSVMVAVQSCFVVFVNVHAMHEYLYMQLSFWDVRSGSMLHHVVPARSLPRKRRACRLRLKD